MTSLMPPDTQFGFHFSCYCFLFFGCIFIFVGQFSLPGTRFCEASPGLSPGDKEAARPCTLLSVHELSGITGRKCTSVAVGSDLWGEEIEMKFVLYTVTYGSYAPATGIEGLVFLN